MSHRNTPSSLKKKLAIKEVLPNLTVNELIEISQVSKPYSELAEQEAKDRLKKMECKVTGKNCLTTLSMCEQMICLEDTDMFQDLDSLKIVNRVYSKNGKSYFGKVCELPKEQIGHVIDWMTPGIFLRDKATYDEKIDNIKKLVLTYVYQRTYL